MPQEAAAIHRSNLKTDAFVNPSLVKLATKLANEGPHKTTTTSRRVRILHKGSFIADTTSALLVWEHPYYPYFYLPWSAFGFHENESSGTCQRTLLQGVQTSHGIETARIYQMKHTKPEGEPYLGLAFMADSPLAGLVRIDFKSVGRWFEEDTPIDVHPKDPFRRVDCLTSLRPIRITLRGADGEHALTLAESPTSVHLLETGLPTRYYLPLSSLNVSYLRPSQLRTKCPYKGEAEYYDVVIPKSGDMVEDKVWDNMVWFYRQPTNECMAIAGMCCFYSDKSDVWLNGVKQ